MKKISFTWLFRKLSSKIIDDIDYFTKLNIIVVVSLFVHRFHLIIFISSEKSKSLHYFHYFCLISICWCSFSHKMKIITVVSLPSPRFYLGWFHGICGMFTLTLTKSFKTFRTCALIIFKTFSPLEKSYTMFSWGSVVQIPITLQIGSLKYLFLCNPRSFALLYAKEILMIDSDSSSSGLSESIYLKKIWNHLRMVDLWKPFLWQSFPSPKTPLTENSEHSEILHKIEQQKIYRSICAPSGGSEVCLR